MFEGFKRNSLIFGESGMEILKNSSVAVIGIGGVGSYVAEALARSGIGRLILVDYDIIDITNVNRQIHATMKTVGKIKVDAMKERLISINPNLIVDAYREKVSEDNKEFLFCHNLDYIADAIDDVSGKVTLIREAKERNIKIISSMGTGNKVNPLDFKVAKIKNTKNCPLSRAMRKRLREIGIDDLKVVYSEELNDYKFSNPVGSTSFVPSVAGLVIASEIVKDLLNGGRDGTGRSS